MSAGGRVAENRDASAVGQFIECFHRLVGDGFLPLRVTFVFPYLRAAEAVDLFRKRYPKACARSQSHYDGYHVIFPYRRTSENPCNTCREVYEIRIQGFIEMDLFGHREVFRPVGLNIFLILQVL